MNAIPTYSLRFISCIVGLIVLGACENDMQEINTVVNTNEASLPIESSKDIEILYSDSAQVKMKLKAGVIDRYIGENSYFEMTSGVEVFFYKPYPQVESELKADYAIGFNAKNGGIDSMEAKRNVFVRNEKGDILNTEHLIWNASKKKIYTPEFVKITTQDEIIWGNGLEAEEDFSRYEIKQVKGQINIKDTTQF